LLVFLRDRHEKCKREAKARAAEQARLLGLWFHDLTRSYYSYW
jgi:hypothetical protein